MRVRALQRRAWLLLLVAAVVLGCEPGAAPVVAPDRPSAVPALPSRPAMPQVDEVVVGVDSLSTGFNPHTVADQTPVGAAVADLVFPSPFHQSPGGGWRLNTALLTSALVTDREPFTVTYHIRDDAAWSNATPIAAEDFVYLAEQMRSQPGVVNPAGYELIDEVVTADGGKTVRVIFSKPYPAWRSLFRHLLPAHLLKDAPGGWDSALDTGIPVSGGPFILEAVDPARGEIVLVRNDRYWATPARLDRLVLRRLPATQLVSALRTGGVNAALFSSPDAAVLGELDRAGLPEPVVLPRPVLARLVLRPAGGDLADRDVRAAVAAALDRETLLAVAGADEAPGELTANAQVLAPSQPDYEPTLPGDSPLVGEGSAPARQLLNEAGYDRLLRGWADDGQLLTLEIAAAADRAPYAQLARRVAIQLRAAGIRVTLRLLPADELVGRLAADGGATARPTASTSTAAPGKARQAPPDGQQGSGGIDVAVLPQPVAADPATTLASVHCPVDVLSGLDGAPPVGLAGFCAPLLQPRVEAALTGEAPAGAVLEAIEPALWQRLISVPLYQPVSVLVAGPRLAGVRAGPLLESPLHGATGWYLKREVGP